MEPRLLPGSSSVFRSKMCIITSAGWSCKQAKSKKQGRTKRFVSNPRAWSSSTFSSSTDLSERSIDLVRLIRLLFAPGFVRCHLFLWKLRLEERILSLTNSQFVLLTAVKIYACVDNDGSITRSRSFHFCDPCQGGSCDL